MLLSDLLSTTVQFSLNNSVLILNSAVDPVVSRAIQQVTQGTVILAEDNIAYAAQYLPSTRTQGSQGGYVDSAGHVRHVAFHDYILHYPATTMDVAILNLLYQPANAWIHYALQLAAYALRPHGRLYVTGAKDRGILSVAKRMQELFGSVETLTITKGHRVLYSQKREEATPFIVPPHSAIFAEGKLDEGTRLLLEALEVHATDEALDIGCGAGFIGLHVARLAQKGHVTMVDVSLAAVSMAQAAITQSGLKNIRVLPSDGVQAVLGQRFDLVVTNPPFHRGGVQTLATAERFIREAAQVLRPHGRFYLVANRFLKYEPTLRACFKIVEEVGGDTRYKVLCGSEPLPVRLK